MRIGWLIDKTDYVGGAELNALAIREAVPAGIEIVDCPANTIWNGEFDLFVIHNCVSYHASVIDQFGNTPVIKMMHDIWPYGDTRLRDWVLQNAKLVVMVSPKLCEWFPYEIAAPVVYVPSAVDVEIGPNGGEIK